MTDPTGYTPRDNAQAPAPSQALLLPLVSPEAAALERADNVITDVTVYDENTLTKVRKGLAKCGLDEQGITDAINEVQNQGVLFREGAPEEATVAVQDDDIPTLSDGYHTMQELYDHRCALTAVLATIGAIGGDSWRSKQHHPEDDPMFAGYFIVGMELPAGTVSYHYPLADWDRFEAVTVLEHSPKWDGHDSAEVVDRLLDFARHLTKAARELGGGTLTFTPDVPKPATQDEVAQ